MDGELIASVVVGAAFVYLGIVSILLVVIDLRAHRLPNRFVLPSYIVGIVLFTIASMLAGDPTRLWRSVGGMMVLFACYFAVRLASPTSLGGGDVKLAGLLGLYLGWMGWKALLVGTMVTFLIGGLHALILLIMRRADRRTRIPFGPAMLAGAWVALASAVVTVSVSAVALP